MQYEIGQEVYTEDGRKAEYAGNIGGRHFVRVVMYRDDDEYGQEEWASDKLTPAAKVFTAAPMEKHDQRVIDARAKVAALREQETAIRQSVLNLQKQEKETIAAIAKFPEMQTALDFLEGRITHVVIENYGGVEVKPLHDALVSYTDGSWQRRTENGMKLLCLFGHEKGKKSRWAINTYFDGSGHYTTVVPFTSEEDARAEVQRRADEAFAAWKADGKSGNLLAFQKSGATIPQEYLDHVAALDEKSKAEKLQKLRAEIAKLEAAL
jgi:hypothetical protein